jgi:hypothetical protein
MKYVRGARIPFLSLKLQDFFHARLKTTLTWKDAPKIGRVGRLINSQKKVATYLHLLISCTFANCISVCTGVARGWQLPTDLFERKTIVQCR